MAEAAVAHLTGNPTDRRLTAATATLAIAAGATAGLSPPSPTGHGVADLVILTVAIAAVAGAAALVPWWLITAAAGVALITAVGLVPTLVALAALIVSCWAGTGRPGQPHPAIVSAGLTMNALAWAQLDWFFGASAIVGIAVGAALLVAGVGHLDRRPRRFAVLGLIGIGVVTGAATAGFAMAALDAREDLANGKRASERAIRYLDHGDFDKAQDQFDRAATLLGRAEDALDGGWGATAQWVPIVAQHRDTALTVSRSSASASEALATALDDIDPDRLRVESGGIDLAAVTALSSPFHDVADAMHELRASVETSRSPWLVAPLDDALDELVTRIDDNTPRLENAVAAVDLAPQLLGADGPRVYVVLFTTPAETRGLGGFVGNYAELTVHDGRIEMTRFGRAHELDRALVEAEARISGPAGFIDRYGGFGYDADGNGLLGTAALRNLTITPHFPWVGQVVAEMYPQVTGTEVDGVIALDPYTLQALTYYTGPIELPSLHSTINHHNAAQFLLRGQYDAANDKQERIDALGEAAEEMMDHLLDGDLPGPTDLASDLGPLTEQRRLLMWSAHDDERDLLAEVGLLGAIPALEGSDGWSVAVTNSGGSKIDTFLERSATYDAETDAETGITTGTIRVELENTAPERGLPGYIIGNRIDLPSGTSRLYVAVYSALPLAEGRVDGDVRDFDAEREVGWNVYDTYVTIPPGESTVIEMTVSGRVDDPETVVTWEQPLVVSEH